MNLKSLLPHRRPHAAVTYRDDPFEIIRQEIARLFDSRPLEGLNADMMKVDVSEDKDGLTISAEAPGVKEEDISVTLSNGFLTIQGEKKEEREEKENNYYMMERSFGSFNRKIQLPYDVEPAKIDAEFKSGVLRIRIPRLQGDKSQEKKIKIKSKS